ncbi:MULTISPECIES: hypothetical protein [Actinokineospora]|uniref:Uncharacterized protein n=1 Tax=Actinokineospora fastidiosa TaxID=1816 RepID=A0A918LDE1_9PSEU|nr:MULTISPECIES: hypothetical protein [Actinokineospora]UVS80309.1 hypothetical protein Actkin_04059 [Actinokineospora sp. UTMC 2448]GGS34379.1 hypothetical protein GCM10010171_31000 [Actinokineospora fastidiosa]
MIPCTVADMTRRLADTPPDFLADPAALAPAAIVSDTLVRLGGRPLTDRLAARFASGEPNWTRLVLVTCWLAADSGGSPERLHDLLATGLADLAALVPAERFATDPDRREELARVLLRALGVVPLGETAEQAADRLDTVDSVRRHRLLADAKAAEERAEAIRRAMAEKRAREAAARYSQV